MLNILTIAVIVQAKIIDRRGRKPLLLAGLVGMSTSLSTLGAAALILPAHARALFLLAMAAFVIFTNTFSATWGPVLWVILAEIFPLSIRGTDTDRRITTLPALPQGRAVRLPASGGRSGRASHPPPAGLR